MACFVFEAEDITVISCLECALVIIPFGERSEVNTKGDWTVAMVEGETVGVQFDRDKSDMGVIRHLQVLRHVVLQTQRPYVSSNVEG